MKLYNQGFPLLYNTFYQGGGAIFCQGGRAPRPQPWLRLCAEAVMQDLVKRSVTNNVNIKTWDRYVDDVLAAVKKDKTNEVLV